MKKPDDSLKFIISHAKAYGFIFPSSQIYEGISALYDYGPYGVVLKNHLKNYWWRAMTDLREDIVGLDSSILMHPDVWKASGHIDVFNDPLIDNKDSGHRYRADVLIEDFCKKIQQRIDKELQKGHERFGKGFDKDRFLAANSKLLDDQERKNRIIQRMVRSLEKEDLQDIKNLIDELGISDPETGSKNWTQVRQFNLMFQTQIGSLTEGSNTVYLRPETAQGIFVNFLQVQKSARMKVPFGIAQIGKAFRNEIVARQFIFRMREFEQMEMQFFVPPSQQMQWYEYWKEARMKWHLALGLEVERYRFYDHDKLAHYAQAAVDIEFCFPFGFKELEGIHSRGDFDLRNHQRCSGKKLEYFDSDKKQSYIPYVIETSIGLDRLFLALFSSCLSQQELPDGSIRSVLKLPNWIAPVKAAIFPLVNKEGLPEAAKRIFHELKWKHSVVYEEKESIGKRYRRQDAIGTPFCFTLDHESLKDQAVTVRYRDSMRQERISISQINSFLERETSMITILKKASL